MEISIPIKELSAAMRKHLATELTVDGQTVKDLRVFGHTFWFEYHCYEGHDSADAKVWYRSHQQCVVQDFADCDPAAFTTFEERADAGHSIVYRVRFADGLEWDVFEDELLDSRDQFCRSDPPKEPEAA